MLASPCGAEMRLRDGTTVIVSPRVLLCVCDQPEERAVLCLKRHGSTYDCTPCMARSNASSNVGDKRPRARSVLKTVTAQMKEAGMRSVYGMGGEIEDLETEYSGHCIVPALAGGAGLGSGCFMLYKLPGFDRLHVRHYCASCVLTTACLVYAVSCRLFFHQQPWSRPSRHTDCYPCLLCDLVLSLLLC